MGERKKNDLKFVTIEPEQTKGASHPRVAAYVDNVVDMIGVYLRVWRTHEASISSVSSAVGFPILIRVYTLRLSRIDIVTHNMRTLLKKQVEKEE